MPKSVCDPFDYEQLYKRSLGDFLTVDGDYAFGKKLLKNLRPFLKVVQDQHMSSNPNIQPQLNTLFEKHLSNPKNLSDLKWTTLANEIALNRDMTLLDMWLNARPNSWEILASTPTTVSRDLEVLTARIIPHLIKTNQPQKIQSIIQTWTTPDKEKIALSCESIIECRGEGPDIFAALIGQTVEKNVVECLVVSDDVVNVYPEYFKTLFEMNVNVFVEEEKTLKKIQGMLPAHAMALLGIFSSDNVVLQCAFQYLNVLPTHHQDECIERLKTLPHAQLVLDASPEIKSVVEKKLLNQALHQIEPSGQRRAKL